MDDLIFPGRPKKPRQTLQHGVAAVLHVTDEKACQIEDAVQILELAPGDWMVIDAAAHAHLLQRAMELETEVQGLRIAAMKPQSRRAARIQARKDRRN